MIRVAFTLIGRRSWTGGHNYLVNLLHALSEHGSSRVQPVLFLGEDVEANVRAPFEAIPGIEVVRRRRFDDVLSASRLRDAALLGSDRLALREFRAHHVSAVFEAAQFYGWRIDLPAIAWVPDFQHRHLRKMFGFKSYWRREIGLRAQILSGRHFMLSSEDARRDCERFYPSTRGRTHVVRFAIPSPQGITFADARATADLYGLPDIFFYLPNQFWSHKNHECVIEALRLLKAKGSRVVIAASGLQDDPRNPRHTLRLKALIREYGLDQNFLLLGLIPHQHVLALMRASSALINPSEFEGWSTTVEEAKAAGTPMILSSLRVHREQAQTNALYFDASSPEQLASILETFVPLAAPERHLLAEKARRVAADAVRRYADEFCALIELVAHPEKPSEKKGLLRRISS